MVQIASRLGMGRATVRKFATAAAFPERAGKPPQPSILDPYVPYLQQRLSEGCSNASQLWREIAAQGYRRVRKQVARWVRHRRLEPAPTGPKKYRGSSKGGSHPAADLANTDTAAPTQPRLEAPRRLVWLLLRSPF
jgi:hypothetical protein